MELKAVITNIQKTLRNNEMLNSGGCVHFAYYLSKKLQELNIKHSLHCFMYTYEDSLDILDSGCRHIVVNIPEVGIIDGHNTFQTMDNFGYFMSKVIDFPKSINLNKLRNTKYLWNSTYSVKYNQIISRVINSNFKNFKQ